MLYALPYHAPYSEGVVPFATPTAIACCQRSHHRQNLKKAVVAVLDLPRLS